MRRAAALKWMAAASVVAAAGCVEGAGEPCEKHIDCGDGLACIDKTCGTCDGAACLPVDLVLTSCDPAGDPMEGSTVLSISVVEVAADGSERDLTPPQVVARNTGGIELPSLPLGQNRRIRVKALERDGAAVVNALGESPLFDVTADQPVSAIEVFLRRVGSFGPPDPRNCDHKLATPRAGHSATLLNDGTVLLAGGYTWESGKQVALRSAEIFDPRRGTFTPLEKTLVANGRAFHTATLLPDGRVLLAGGLGKVGDGLMPLVSADVYDPTQKSFSTLVMKSAHHLHSAAMTKNGNVLISGGVIAIGGAPVPVTEVFRPNERGLTAFVLAPSMKYPRFGHASATVGGDKVYVMGGLADDGRGNYTKPLKTVEIYSVIGDQFQKSADDGPPLSAERASPLVVPLLAGNENGVIVLGASSANASTQAAFDFIDFDASTDAPARSAQAVNPRVDGCAASFFGGALVVGGRNPTTSKLVAQYDTYTLDVSVPDAVKIVARGDSNLPTPRANLACTTLADGTVLVSGGETGDGTARKVVADVQVYQRKQ